VARIRGFYIFDDISDPGSVYIGKTKNLGTRSADHIRQGRLAGRDDAICIHFCGSNDDLLVEEHIFKVAFRDMGFRLSSDIEARGERWYEARQAGTWPFDK
jgi:hypothetical protein